MRNFSICHNVFLLYVIHMLSFVEQGRTKLDRLSLTMIIEKRGKSRPRWSMSMVITACFLRIRTYKDHIYQHFPTCRRIMTQTNFKNIVAKEECAHDETFSHLPQCFITVCNKYVYMFSFIEQCRSRWDRQSMII